MQVIVSEISPVTILTNNCAIGGIIAAIPVRAIGTPRTLFKNVGINLKIS